MWFVGTRTMALAGKLFRSWENKYSETIAGTIQKIIH